MERQTTSNVKNQSDKFFNNKKGRYAVKLVVKNTNGTSIDKDSLFQVLFQFYVRNAHKK
ncbi:MAG: hypothetical protein IPG12_03385 [Saprospiraceae bacterium]|nr:hypothetical protein [Saprospiraceae bacterium]